MRPLIVNIPPRLGALTLPGVLQPVKFRPALPALTFSERRPAITIPVFPVEDLTEDFIKMNGDFVTINGERIWF